MFRRNTLPPSSKRKLAANKIIRETGGKKEGKLFLIIWWSVYFHILKMEVILSFEIKDYLLNSSLTIQKAICKI
jgi:hypothetical protein